MKFWVAKLFLQKYYATFATSRMYEIMETTIYNRNGIIRYSKSIHATTTTTLQFLKHHTSISNILSPMERGTSLKKLTIYPPSKL